MGISERRTGLSSDAILKGDLIERLVDQGRIPSGFAQAFMGGVEQIIVHIPPEGTQKGDQLVGSFADGFHVVSPSGEDRGPTEGHFLSPAQADQVRERVMKHYYKDKSPKE